jgi:hypothetical protein
VYLHGNHDARVNTEFEVSAVNHRKEANSSPAARDYCLVYLSRCTQSSNVSHRWYGGHGWRPHAADALSDQITYQRSTAYSTLCNTSFLAIGDQLGLCDASYTFRGACSSSTSIGCAKKISTQYAAPADFLSAARSWRLVHFPIRIISIRGSAAGGVSACSQARPAETGKSAYRDAVSVSVSPDTPAKSAGTSSQNDARTAKECYGNLTL